MSEKSRVVGDLALMMPLVNVALFSVERAGGEKSVGDGDHDGNIRGVGVGGHWGVER